MMELDLVLFSEVMEEGVDQRSVSGLRYEFLPRRVQRHQTRVELSVPISHGHPRGVAEALGRMLTSTHTGLTMLQLP